MLSGFNHLTLAITDLSRSVTFYHELLQLSSTPLGTAAPICHCRVYGYACRLIRYVSRSQVPITPTMRSPSEQ